MKLSEYTTGRRNDVSRSLSRGKVIFKSNVESIIDSLRRRIIGLIRITQVVDEEPVTDARQSLPGLHFDITLSDLDG